MLIAEIRCARMSCISRAIRARSSERACITFATGPRTGAGELADGVLLNYLPASHVPWSVERIREGVACACSVAFEFSG